MLNRQVSAPEMKKAVFDMGPHKAPGPDGFLPTSRKIGVK